MKPGPGALRAFIGIKRLDPEEVLYYSLSFLIKSYFRQVPNPGEIINRKEAKTTKGERKLSMEMPRRDELMEQSDAVREMVRSDGWKIIGNWINGRITSGIDDLMTCPVDEVLVRRAKIQAYRDLLLKIREIIDAGK